MNTLNRRLVGMGYSEEDASLAVDSVGADIFKNTDEDLERALNWLEARNEEPASASATSSGSGLRTLNRELVCMGYPLALVEQAVAQLNLASEFRYNDKDIEKAAYIADSLLMGPAAADDDVESVLLAERLQLEEERSAQEAQDVESERAARALAEAELMERRREEEEAAEVARRLQAEEDLRTRLAREAADAVALAEATRLQEEERRKAQEARDAEMARNLATEARDAEMARRLAEQEQEGEEQRRRREAARLVQESIFKGTPLPAGAAAAGEAHTSSGGVVRPPRAPVAAPRPPPLAMTFAATASAAGGSGSASPSLSPTARTPASLALRPPANPRGARYVIIDGANVGYSYASIAPDSDRHLPDLRGVELVANKLRSMGLTPVAVFHEQWCQGRYAQLSAESQRVMDALRAANALVPSPGQRDDDGTSIGFAVEYRCPIITNDNFRDHIARYKDVTHKWIRETCVKYTLHPGGGVVFALEDRPILTHYMQTGATKAEVSNLDRR